MTAPSTQRLLTLVFATTLTSLMANSLLAPVIPDILAAFGRPDRDSGLLVSASSLPGIFVAPIIGVLADRFGRRSVLAPCLGIFGLAGIGVALAPSFAWLLIFRVLMGFGAAGLVNLAIVLLGDRFEGQDRTYWVGINAGVLTLALAIFPLIGGGLSELGGWRLALAPYGLGVLAAMGAWLVLDDARPSQQRTLADQLGGARAVLRRPSILANIAAAAIIFAIIFGVFLAALPTHLENKFGLSAGSRGLIIGLPAIGSSLAAFNLGKIRQRFNTVPLLLTTSILWIVAFVTMGLASSLVVLVGGALLYGLGEGAMIPSMQDAALSETPAEHRAVVLASWTASARFGQTIGPLAAGLIIAGPGTTVALYAGALGAAVLLGVFLLTKGQRFTASTN